MKDQTEYEPVTLKIVKKASGNYTMQYSSKELNNLIQWHKTNHLARKWKATEDGKAIILM